MRVIIHLFLIIIFISPNYGSAATIQNVKQSPANKKIDLAGTCRGNQAIVELFSTTSTSLIYSSVTDCQKDQYHFDDDFAKWGIADGIYRVIVSDNESLVMNEESERLITLPWPSPSSTTLNENLNEPQENSEPAEFSLFSALIKSWLNPILESADAILTHLKTTILTAIHIFTKELILVSGGAITLPTGQNQMSGNGIISAHAKTATIINSLVSEGSKIIISPTSPTFSPLSVTLKNKGSFTVSIPSESDADIPFDWIILNTYEEKIK